MNESIFKACDIRGVYPSEIDEASVRSIGQAIGTILSGGRVIVGGDVRLSTPVLKSAVVDGLVWSGCDVTDIGIVPTPAFYFARHLLRVEPGVMVTASHNPPDYNGLKIVLGTLPITEVEIARIRELAFSDEFRSSDGSSVQAEVVADYERHVTEMAQAHLLGIGRLPNVVIDCGNGCYSEIAPRVFGKLGIPFVPLFCDPDGLFPNRSPNSAVVANLSVLRERVTQEKADLGIAFDGDGDRVSIVDERGEVLTPDQLISVVARHMPHGIRPGDEVVLDQKCSSSVSDVVRQLGGRPVLEKSGHTFIKTRMTSPPTPLLEREGRETTSPPTPLPERQGRETTSPPTPLLEREGGEMTSPRTPPLEREGGGARLGGEVSGHLFYRELWGGDDGLYSAIVMTGIVGRCGRLSELVRDLPKYATTPEIRLQLDADPDLINRIAGRFAAETVSRLDGVRVEFKYGWALARLSVTEPVVTLRFEGRDDSSLARVINAFLARAPELAEQARQALDRAQR